MPWAAVSRLAAELSDGRLSYLAGGAYSAQEVGEVAANMAANMLANGTILASPSNGSVIGVINGTVCAYPDYYYMWTRDAAITMRSLFRALAGSEDGANSLLDPNSAAFDQFIAYANLVGAQWDQLDPNTDCPPSFTYCPIVPEAKFFVNGTVYDQSWGRPQNDGPALVALALLEYANMALDAGRNESWLRKHGMMSVIENALNFVQFWYMEASIGPWENRYAQHFYVSAVQRRALAVGATLTKRLSSSNETLASSAKNYAFAAKKMTSIVSSFWSDENQMVRARLGDLYDFWPPRCFLSQANATSSAEPCSVDTQVLIGSLYSMARGVDSVEFPDVLPPTHVGMLATASLLVHSMAPHYMVNALDDEQGLPGVLIGRFPGDNYQGYSENGTASYPNSPEEAGSHLWGNPWFLTSQVLAELLYELASAAAVGELQVDKLSRSFLSEAPGWGEPVSGRGCPKLRKVCLLRHGGGVKCARRLLKAGDGVMARAKHHALPGLHMSEQIEGHSGHPFPPGAAVSAPDLTWSYGSVLDALAARKKAEHAIQRGKL